MCGPAACRTVDPRAHRRFVLHKERLDVALKVNVKTVVELAQAQTLLLAGTHGRHATLRNAVDFHEHLGVLERQPGPPRTLPRPT